MAVVSTEKNAASRKRTKPCNSSSEYLDKCLLSEKVLWQEKRTKKEGQVEIKSKSESEKKKLRPEWPQLSQEKLKAIFGQRPKKTTFVFEDSDGSEDEDGDPVEERKHMTNAKVERPNKDEKRKQAN